MWTYIVILGLFLVFMLGMGLYFSRRQTSTDSYFTARRSIPGWAMGLSLFATLVSSVSFIAYPAAGYEGKWWASVVPVLASPFLLLLILFVLIPMYRDVVSISVYEYIERRFDRVARVYSTSAFLLHNFAKVAFVYYLVALTVNTITGWDVQLMIIVLGIVTVAYTMIGGIEAVIWTDVVQGIVLWVGGVVALSYVLLAPSGGPAAVVGTAWENNRFDLGDAAMTISRPTLWMLLAAGFVDGLQKHAGDQAVVQRFLVAHSRREAMRGAVLSTIVTIFSALLFTFLGSCLWSFYQIEGTTLPSEVATNSEKVLPYFLRTQVSAALSAIVLAALFSAAMSTVSSALNGFGAVAVEDYYRLLRPSSNDRERLMVGRTFVAFSGGLCIAFSVLLVPSRGTAIELWYIIASIVSSGIVGLFFLALGSRRANPRGIHAGIVAAMGFTIWAVLTMSSDPNSNNFRTFDLGLPMTPVHGYMIGVISNALFIIVGLGASFLFPDNGTTRNELTFWGWWLAARRRGAHHGM